MPQNLLEIKTFLKTNGFCAVFSHFGGKINFNQIPPGCNNPVSTRFMN